MLYSRRGVVHFRTRLYSLNWVRLLPPPKIPYPRTLLLFCEAMIPPRGWTGVHVSLHPPAPWYRVFCKLSMYSLRLRDWRTAAQTRSAPCSQSRSDPCHSGAKHGNARRQGRLNIRQLCCCVAHLQNDDSSGPHSLRFSRGAAAQETGSGCSGPCKRQP